MSYSKISRVTNPRIDKEMEIVYSEDIQQIREALKRLEELFIGWDGNPNQLIFRMYAGVTYILGHPDRTGLWEQCTEICNTLLEPWGEELRTSFEQWAALMRITKGAEQKQCLKLFASAQGILISKTQPA
jgi:hypothetical protein